MTPQKPSLGNDEVLILVIELADNLPLASHANADIGSLLDAVRRSRRQPRR